MLTHIGPNNVQVNCALHRKWIVKNSCVDAGQFTIYFSQIDLSMIRLIIEVSTLYNIESFVVSGLLWLLDG